MAEKMRKSREVMEGMGKTHSVVHVGDGEYT